MPARVRCDGKLEAVASRRSASQTLITDCLVTPSLQASRSSESIIHVGKSTFTRFCSCRTRLALDRSKEAVMSKLLLELFSFHKVSPLLCVRDGRVIPKILRFDKTDVVLHTIGLALFGVKIEGSHGIKTVP